MTLILLVLVLVLVSVVAYVAARLGSGAMKRDKLNPIFGWTGSIVGVVVTLASGRSGVGGGVVASAVNGAVSWGFSGFVGYLVGAAVGWLVSRLVQEKP